MTHKEERTLSIGALSRVEGEGARLLVRLDDPQRLFHRVNDLDRAHDHTAERIVRGGSEPAARAAWLASGDNLPELSE